MGSRLGDQLQKKSPEFGGKIEYDSEHNSASEDKFLTPYPEKTFANYE